MVLFKWLTKIKSVVNSYFTFQYGSIQIWDDLKSVWDNTIFTFQYGSIQIQLQLFCTVYLPPFTFQYGSIQIGAKQYLQCVKAIYIPIWFYSN